MGKLSLFLLAALLAATTSFLVGSYFEKGSLITFLTYPNLLLASGLFALAVYRLHRDQWHFRRLLPRDRLSWGVVVAATTLLLLIQPFAFKIVTDEVILAVKAEVLHFSRMAMLPYMGNDYEGGYQFISNFVEKRPFFFPFVLSLVHDLTGYRWQNAFILNGLLTLLLVLAINCLGRLFAGRKGGWLAVLLATTLPLLGIMASSGNLEILNLAMLGMIILFSWLYLNNPCGIRLVPLVYALVLFFQIRYENGIFLLPFGMLILMGWRKAGRIILPWQVIASPLLLVLPAMHYFIVARGSGQYFQQGPDGRESTFSTAYFADNVGAAGRFLFSVGGAQPNSILITLLGLGGALVFLLHFVGGGRRNRNPNTSETVMLCLFLAVLLHLGLVFIFNFGVFDTYITARLSLPLQFFLILIVPFTFRRFSRRAYPVTLAVSVAVIYLVFLNLPPGFVATAGLQFAAGAAGLLAAGIWVWRRIPDACAGLCLLAGAYMIAIGLPVQHSQRYSEKAFSNRMIMRELEFIGAQAGQRSLWISSIPYAPLLTRTNCLPLVDMVRNPTPIREALSTDRYEAVYISRWWMRDGEGRLKLLEQHDQLDPGIFITQNVLMAPIGPNGVLQIDRLAAIRTTSDPAPAEPSKN